MVLRASCSRPLAGTSDLRLVRGEVVPGGEGDHSASSSAGAPQSATEREESRPLSWLCPSSWGNFVGLSHMMCRLPPESNVTALHLGLSPICDSSAGWSAHLVWCQFQDRGWSAEIQADPRLFPPGPSPLTSSTIVQLSSSFVQI